MIHALTLPPPLQAELAGRPGGAVHSVFDRVINIATPAAHLWALATTAVAGAPRTICTDATSFAAVAVGDEVRACRDEVRCGPLAVNLRTARPWIPVLPSARPTGQAVSVLRASWHHQGATARPAPFAAAAATALDTRLRHLCDHLAHGTAAQVEQATRHLIGLGTGLTPSGDDTLVGLALTGAWLGGAPGRLPGVLAQIDARSLTTAVAAAALASAAAGTGPQFLHDLLSALAGGNEADIHAAATHCYAYGHTSGTDLVAGVLVGLDLYFQPGGTR